MMRIGIYCGSFSPVHRGHICIAEECLEQKLVDEVMIIATGNYWNKNDLLPLEDRLNMLESVRTENILIDRKYNDFPYTYQIFQQLKQDHPTDELVLIIGGDNLPGFDRWKEYRTLLEYDFIVIGRDEIDSDRIHELMKGYHKTNYEILDIGSIDISSTYIREHLDNYELIKDMIDPNVYTYLKKMSFKH